MDAMVECPQCGREVDDALTGCPYCGTELPRDGAEPQPRRGPRAVISALAAPPPNRNNGARKGDLRP